MKPRRGLRQRATNSGNCQWQKAASGRKVSGADATNGGKLIVAYCRLLLRDLCARLVLPDLVGDGV
jgi:hypothetical protein